MPTYLSRPADICDRSVLGPAVVVEGADKSHPVSIKVFGGVVQSEGIIFHKVVSLAHGSLKNLGRMVHKLHKVCRLHNRLALLVRQI